MLRLLRDELLNAARQQYIIKYRMCYKS